MECPTIFYDADIKVDAILSYQWLAKNKVNVRCERHGLEVNDPRGPMWVPGVVVQDHGQGITYSTDHIFGVEAYASMPFKIRTQGLNPGGEYTVRWPFFHEIIRNFGIKPQRDCFATPPKKRCNNFYSEKIMP